MGNHPTRAQPPPPPPSTCSISISPTPLFSSPTRCRRQEQSAILAKVLRCKHSHPGHPVASTLLFAIVLAAALPRQMYLQVPTSSGPWVC
ncbi:hypothetical protein V2G26_011651 [Clonostachys chloroleuca]